MYAGLAAFRCGFAGWIVGVVETNYVGTRVKMTGENCPENDIQACFYLVVGAPNFEGLGYVTKEMFMVRRASGGNSMPKTGEIAFSGKWTWVSTQKNCKKTNLGELIDPNQTIRA